MTTRRTLQVRIEGRVQGVCYRAWSADAARGLRITGNVRNRRDGAVELILQGDEHAIAAMLKLCRIGPPAAKVDSIAILQEWNAAPLETFEILSTC